VVRRRHDLDYLGAGLLATGCTLLILGLLEGGEAWPWSSWPGIGTPLAGLAVLAVLVRVERRAAEPVLPLWVFRRRILVTSSLVALGVGGVLIGLTSYVPTFLQGVGGVGPLVAGFALATMTVGWPISASQASKAYLRIGFRATALIGSSVAVVGTVLTAALSGGPSVAAMGATCFVVGAGLGFVAAPTLVAAQSTVGWSERGVVTATNLFSRSMGSAVGVAVFGAVANAAMGPVPTVSELARASRHVFLAVAVTAVLMAAAVALMPRRVAVVDPGPAAEAAAA
jgi:Na+/melibiose symporter-like transporter